MIPAWVVYCDGEVHAAVRAVDVCLPGDAAGHAEFVSEPVFEVRRTALVAASPTEGVSCDRIAVFGRRFWGFAKAQAAYFVR